MEQQAHSAPKRISIVGNSGSGKTTLGRRIAARLGVPYVELDAIYHQPGWTTLDDERFAADVRGRVAGDGWVIDGNYKVVQPIVWARAEAVVWLDLPRYVVFPQLLWRTVSRALLGTELWNGNREEWRKVFHWDPNVSVLAWSWTQHAAYANRYARAMTDPANAHLTFHRLRSRREAERFVASLG